MITDEFFFPRYELKQEKWMKAHELKHHENTTNYSIVGKQRQQKDTRIVCKIKPKHSLQQAGTCQRDENAVSFNISFCVIRQLSRFRCILALLLYFVDVSSDRSLLFLFCLFQSWSLVFRLTRSSLASSYSPF